MDYIFPPAQVKTIPVDGLDSLFPIHRIFCVGRNYVAHAIEMGGTVDHEAPWYFTKSLSAACPTASVIPYPPGTSDFHYEMELVVAIGAPVFRADKTLAQAAIFGYGCGLDMTRRDCQQDAKDQRRPWCLGKDVENSAVFAALTPAERAGNLADKRIHLDVNGVTRQDATLADMVWTPADIVAHLSGYYHLQPGDVILTGTPAGVGPVIAGDRINGGIDGLAPISLSIGPAE